MNRYSRKAASRWKVTLYNQHVRSAIVAWGKTRRDAFNNARTKAGLKWIRHGEDKTGRDHNGMYCDMWAERIMPYTKRRTMSLGVNDPCGLGIMIERAAYVDWLDAAK